MSQSWGCVDIENSSGLISPGMCWQFRYVGIDNGTHIGDKIGDDVGNNIGDKIGDNVGENIGDEIGVKMGD